MLGPDFKGLCYIFRVCYSEGNGKIIEFQEDLMTFSLWNNVNIAWHTDWESQTKVRETTLKVVVVPW